MSRFKERIDSKAAYQRIFGQKVRLFRSQGLSQNESVAKAYQMLGKNVTGRKA
jgi:hypothetical protein|tara:strand:+ start:1725 stop:1883 length:159 start_codon:yes stop_codon:yes gene_type:complete